MSARPKSKDKSMWSLGWKPNSLFSPHVLTTWLSSSLAPTGTDSWSKLGRRISRYLISPSQFLISSSKVFIMPGISLISFITDAMSLPSFFSLDTSWERTFLLCLRRLASVINALLLSSNFNNSSRRTILSSAPLFSRSPRTKSGSLLMRLMSSIAHNPLDELLREE